MKQVKVLFEDGNTITTDINGSFQSIINYYRVGKLFNIGSAGTDNTQAVKHIEVSMINATTIADAEEIIDQLIIKLGGGFHPDTPIIDYVNVETNEPIFKLEQIVALQRLLEQTFKIFAKFGEGYIYSYSNMVLERHLEK